MVTIHFKLTDAGSVEIALDAPRPLEDLLQETARRAGIELGGFIAVRKGKVLKTRDRIHDGDAIDVFPAISGG